ncbi:MAG: hypothetical protein DWQ19_12215 [Crenarchaeota archaeon]|nr:MAG: hypothetical protein DWQ19_12215 [Thermoproteota archaeon]
MKNITKRAFLRLCGLSPVGLLAVPSKSKNFEKYFIDEDGAWELKYEYEFNKKTVRIYHGVSYFKDVPPKLATWTVEEDKPFWYGRINITPHRIYHDDNLIHQSCLLNLRFDSIFSDTHPAGLERCDDEGFSNFINKRD